MTQEAIRPAPAAGVSTHLHDVTSPDGISRNLIRDPEAIVTIPDNPRWGYVRSRYMLRTALVILAVTVVALALLVFGGSRWTTAAGISILVPGGGFLYDGWPILFVLTWALFWLSWNFWVGFGAGVHVYTVYLLSVVGGVALAEGPRLGLESGTTWEWAVPVLLFGAALYVVHHIYNAIRGRKTEASLRQERDTLLANVDQEVLDGIIASYDPPELRSAAQGFDPVGVKHGAGGLQPPLPVTDADAALARYLLRITLQPVSSFEGWDWGKNAVEPSALRYQVTDVGTVLATLQANYLRAYPSLVEQAQRNVVGKAQEVPVWGYWYFENFFGNLTRKPDPIGEAGAQNIMFTGFLAKHLAHFEAATHDHRYDQPGALRFDWEDGQSWSYSYPEIAAHSATAFAEAPLGLWPCEPGQVYPVCNEMGAAGVQGFGALHDSDEWTRVSEKYSSALENEWMRPNGDFYGHFNARLGMNVGSLTWNDGTSPMFMDSNQFIYMLGRTMHPEIAARMYILGKNPETLGFLPVEDGALQLPDLDATGEKPGFFTRLFVKFPNFKHFLSGAWVDMEKTGFAMSNAVMYAGIADLARQFGRDDVADAAIAGVDKVHLTNTEADGRPYAATLNTIGLIAKARWGRLYKQDDFLTARVPRYDGPILESAPHPDTLVAYANGRDGILCITIEPTDKPGRFPLTFDRLVPSTDYTVDGADITFRTDDHGRASTVLPLTKRTTLLISPTDTDRMTVS